MKISVIGTGYVGTVSAACFAELGHDVICVDVEKTKIDRINAGISPIYEEGLSELLEKHAGKNSRIKTVHRHSEPGFGNAVREGFKNATGDIVIPVMGDLSDDPQDVPKLVRKIDEGYDIAYGSRFIEGGATEGYP